MSTPFVIFTPGKPELNLTDFERDSRRTWFEHKLTQLGYSFRKVAGSYKGAAETSYLVLVEDQEQLPALYRLAEAFKQESVLYVDSQGYAALFDADGNWLTELGKFSEISESEARELDAYTYADGKYYAARS